MNESYTRKMDKLLVIQERNVQRVKRNFTGKIILHWKDGELKKEEVNFSREIK